jgi:hypothetical protein
MFYHFYLLLGNAYKNCLDKFSGIAPEIYPNLFNKFSAKSEKGREDLDFLLQRVSLKGTGGNYGLRRIATVQEPHLLSPCPHRPMILMEA